MSATAVYYAVYRVGAKLPTALFLDEQDAKEWHDNPAVYKNCTRRITVSPTHAEMSSIDLLRDIITGDPNSVEDDKKMQRAIERGRRLLENEPPNPKT